MQQYKPRRLDEWRHATPHAALTDASPKGRFCFVPAALLPVQMPDGFDFGSGDVFPSSVSVARSVAAAFEG